MSATRPLSASTAGSLQGEELNGGLSWFRLPLTTLMLFSFGESAMVRISKERIIVLPPFGDCRIIEKMPRGRSGELGGLEVEVALSPAPILEALTHNVAVFCSIMPFR